MLDLLVPDSGDIELGIDKKSIRVVPDHPFLPQKLTVDQWMNVLEKFYGPAPINLDLETELNLNGSWKIKDLSTGQKRLVSLFPIFYGKPQLIILDEPTNYLDVIIRTKVLGMIKEQVENMGIKIIIASHRIDEIELFAREVILLNRGRLITNIPLQLDHNLGYRVRVNNPNLLKTYLDTAKVDYLIEETLMGQAFNVKKINEIIEPLQWFNDDGGVVYGINVINSLENQLLQFK
jgi:ABC-type multidrug transport system ATPase subunit